MSTHLLAMSFDAMASPVVHFRDLPSVHVAGRVPCGWGFGWYPEGDNAAAVVKDPSSTGDDEVVRSLHDWARFRSTVFIAFVLGAARRRTQQDTHPFRVRYAGRDWILTHNGTIRNHRERLPLGDDPVLEPAGRTDSEHLLCWLVSRFREAGARTLEDFGWGRLHALLHEINDPGCSANLVLTDGRDLVAFHDVRGYNEMYWTRRLPNTPTTTVRSGIVELDLEDARIRNVSVVLFSSRPPLDDIWVEMAPGQMLVARRGGLIWDSLYGGRPPGRKIGPGRPPREKRAPAPESPPSPALVTYRAPSRIGREYEIHHATAYRYTSSVHRSMHLLRLLPVHDYLQEVVEHTLEVSVSGVHRNFEDVFGNQTTQIDVETPFRELRILSRSVVRVHARAYDALAFPNRRTSMPLVWMPWQRQMMNPYLLPPELPETELMELSEFAMAAADQHDNDVVETMIGLNETIFQDFDYVPGETSLATTPYQVFCTRRGVCQDFANLLICLARLLGVPARYRVGYLYTGSDYENKLQSEASHAWVELYLPFIGWRGFDPTNGYMVGADHVRVACGRNYRDATPTAGTIFKGGGGENMSIEVRVEARD